MQTASGSTEGEVVGFSRPAVTTGAVLPWRGRSSLSLGQPRAIHSSYNSSLPTITVASPSTTKHGALPSFQPDKPGVCLTSPFEGNDDGQPVKQEPTDEETCCEPAELVDNKLESEDGGPQQTNLHATTSALSSDTRQPGNLPLPGSQTVTTAQNLQGMRALGPGKQLSVSDWGFGHSSQAFTLDDGAPLVLTIPSGNTAVTTGQNQPYFSYESDSGTEEGRVVVRREGLRSSSKRHLQDSSCDPEARDSSEEKQMGNEFHADAPGVSDEERRRIRRRINNRESARRVREKREADLTSATFKVAELEAEQVRLQTHCAEVEASCKLLHKEVAEVRGQWQKAVADNSRLKTELHYQRNNVQLGLGMQGLAQGHGTHTPASGQGSNPACMPTEAEMAADLGLGGFELDLFSSAQGSGWPAW